MQKKHLHNDPSLKNQRQELRRNQTDAEKAFWTKVRNREFYGMRFFRQYSVGPYILDFYCPEIQLAVELDGGQHNQSTNREQDTVRTAYLKAEGIQIVRFWNHEVLLDMEGVLTKLTQEIPPLKVRGGEGEL
ncbi:MAG: endonuclease domain-containing protein [Nitrospirales bacterium]|nr:endonuclease domain-containing protein [Nitrospirales bacterium]